MLFNQRFVFFVLGLLLLVEGAFMLLSGMVALYYQEYDFPYHLVSALISSSAGLLLAWFNKKVPRDVGKREGYIIVPDLGKWILSFLMLLGRLELFSVLILFSPDFWRNN